MAKAFDLIADERERQKTEEGWTSDHDDDEHRNGELARAANCYRAIGNLTRRLPDEQGTYEP